MERPLSKYELKTTFTVLSGANDAQKFGAHYF